MEKGLFTTAESLVKEANLNIAEKKSTHIFHRSVSIIFKVFLFMIFKSKYFNGIYCLHLVFYIKFPFRLQPILFCVVSYNIIVNRLNI